MSIKCTEHTEIMIRHLTIHTVVGKRYLQQRKRSLNSMGWRYHEL